MACLYGNAQEEVVKYGDATLLSTVVNSNQDDIMPLVSPSGETLFFVRDEEGQNIFSSTKDGDTWGQATVKTSHLNNKLNNAVVGISKDGNTLYLIDAYKKKKNDNQGIAISHLKGEKWSNPEYVEIPNMTYINDHFYGFYVNPDESVMLISMVSESGQGKEDLHISLKEGDNWTAPKSLGANVNSSGYEMSPFLSPDNNRIYFSSNGFGGEGDADIFYIDKLGDDWFTWSNPVNLGSNVNSAGFDAYFSIGMNNLAYFSSNRNNGQNDIFSTQITIEIIEEEEPFVETIPEEEPVVIEEKAQNAIYKVQIAAYENASNFDASHLSSFGNIEKVVLEDGITRFTLGEFKTLDEAIKYKEEVIEKGQPDAFVIMYSEGERLYPELDNGSNFE